MNAMALVIEVRALSTEDLVDAGTCGSDGCNTNASWEILQHDLLGRDQVFGLPAPQDIHNDSEVWASQVSRYYCDEHARQLCIDAGVELPVGLRT